VRVEVRQGADKDKDWDDMKQGIVIVILSSGDLRVVAKDENCEVKIKARAVVGSG